jgi:hypothetical protein
MKDGKVYLYEERHSSAQVVGKFFMSEGNHSANAVERMRPASSTICSSCAGTDWPVIRITSSVPLGTNAWLNSILVEEYAEGIPLSVLRQSARFIMGNRNRCSTS